MSTRLGLARFARREMVEKRFFVDCGNCVVAALLVFSRFGWRASRAASPVVLDQRASRVLRRAARALTMPMCAWCAAAMTSRGRAVVRPSRGSGCCKAHTAKNVPEMQPTLHATAWIPAMSTTPSRVRLILKAKHFPGPRIPNSDFLRKITHFFHGKTC